MPAETRRRGAGGARSVEGFRFSLLEGMTMYRIGMTAAAGVVALLLSGQEARAQNDTVRLGGTVDAKTTTLAFDGQSETTLMRGVRGFVGYGHGVGYGRVGFSYGARIGYGGYGGYGYGYGGYYRPYAYSSYAYRPFYS